MIPMVDVELFQRCDTVRYGRRTLEKRITVLINLCIVICTRSVYYTYNSDNILVCERNVAVLAKRNMSR